MLLDAFQEVGERTSIHYPESLLQSSPCGLHRVSLDEAKIILPQFQELYDSVPIPKDDWHNWEIDLKIHMLMPNQYPCVPNWHCDNVPRVDGKTRFDLIEDDTPRMYLWLSDNPTTEFLRPDVKVACVNPQSHKDVAKPCNYVTGYGGSVKIPAQQWISMSQRTPHRGTKSDKHQWRIFARLTHKSIMSARP